MSEIVAQAVAEPVAPASTGSSSDGERPASLSAARASESQSLLDAPESPELAADDGSLDEASPSGRTPHDRRRLLVALIAASSAVAMGTVGALLLHGGDKGNATPPRSAVPAVSLPVSPPPTPTEPPKPKAEAVILAAVAPTEKARTGTPETAVIPESEPDQRHAKTGHGQRAKTKKLAHLERPSSSKKSHLRARSSGRAARNQAVASAPPDPVADPATRSRAAYQEGNTRLFSGDIEPAIKAYQEAIRLNRKDPAGYRGLGLAYTQAGNGPDAVKAFSRYLKLARTAKDRDLITERIRVLRSQ